mmetsp:Transcript_2211/g.5125  ORF Transcript_2211/g.5125 Transcript_2211/m.5125 type:complete len:600 (+) Transcript_2211:347-2146(+)
MAASAGWRTALLLLTLSSSVVAEGRGARPDSFLLALGDSLQDIHSDNGSSIPDAAGQVAGMQVYNRAVSGARVLSGNDTIPSQYRRGPEWHAGWVLVNGGANDAGLACGRGMGIVDRIVSEDATAGVMVDLVETILEDENKVMLMSYYEPMKWSEFADCKDEMLAFAERYEKLAERLQGVWFVDIRDVMSPSKPEYYEEDGSHPSPMGSMAIGEFVGDRIKQIAQKIGELRSSPRDYMVTLDSLQEEYEGMTSDGEQYYGEEEWVIHDPSEIVEIDGLLMVGVTGKAQEDGYGCGLETWYILPGESKFTPGQCLLQKKPDWIAEYVPTNDGAFWAPGFLDSRTMYYTVPTGDAMGDPEGSQSCIGMVKATGTAPNLVWEDHGSPILCQSEGEENEEEPEPPALDPATFTDDDGKVYLLYGGAHIWITELNATTGKHINGQEWDNGDSGVFTHLANGPARGPNDDDSDPWVEAAYIHKEGDYYYLFLNWYGCCNGADSTYEIYVGRSPSITGPYYDKDGVSMLETGGTLFMDSSTGYIGPGHASIFSYGDNQVFTHHYYDADGVPWAFIEAHTLSWSEEGWPILENVWDPMDYWERQSTG